MSQIEEVGNRLDRPVDARDHVLGPAGADITLVEYGSHDCPHCRADNDRTAEVCRRLGNRRRHVFRHRPVTGSDLVRRAAELAERAGDECRFWGTQVELMTCSESLSEDDR